MRELINAGFTCATILLLKCIVLLLLTIMEHYAYAVRIKWVRIVFRTLNTALTVASILAVAYAYVLLLYLF